jgi:hypothetical protein
LAMATLKIKQQLISQEHARRVPYKTCRHLNKIS